MKCLRLCTCAGAVALSRAAFGPGTGQILLDDVSCSGTESRLVECVHSTTHNCGHNEDAGVRCLIGMCMIYNNN